MTILGIIILLTGTVLLMRPSPRGAVVGLLLGAACVPLREAVSLGISLPVVRVLIFLGLLRIVLRRESPAGGMQKLDWLALLWGVWAIFSSLFHDEGVFMTRLGEVANLLGSYFVFRALIQSFDDIRFVFKTCLLLLVPVALAMLIEKVTARNVFALLQGISAEIALRHGHIRAQGPFSHAILAGTVGAVCFPMALYFWNRDRRLSWLGLGATGAVVFASGSSGPVMAVMGMVGAFWLWRHRQYVRALCWAALIMFFALDLVMNDPAYYLIARIDITGGSTGYYRAAFLQSAFTHFNEWWLLGTDVTRHWMPTGNYSMANHTDITNHYIAMGVEGGLVLMLLFIALVVAGFRTVSKTVRLSAEEPVEDPFLVWTLGCILFGHVIAFFSVSYYDQSVVFLALEFALLRVVSGIVFAPTVAETEYAPLPAAEVHTSSQPG